MDAKNAFLHDDLREKIYVTLSRLLLQTLPRCVKAKAITLWVKTSFSCLIWQVSFHSLGLSFTQSRYDSSLFNFDSKAGIVLLLIYVDDVVITRTDWGLIIFKADLVIISYEGDLEVRFQLWSGLAYINTSIQRSWLNWLDFEMVNLMTFF